VIIYDANSETETLVDEADKMVELWK